MLSFLLFLYSCICIYRHHAHMHAFGKPKYCTATTDNSDSMNIYKYITFVSSSTRSSTSSHLVHNSSRTSATWHFYFNRVVLLWNVMPSTCIDLSLSIPTIKHQLILHLWNHFIQKRDNPCSFHYICPCNNYYNSSRVWFLSLP